jgi:hypothetical protein
MFYCEPTKSDHEEVIRELARAKYNALMSAPETRKVVLHQALEFIQSEIRSIQEYATDNEGCRIDNYSYDDAKRYFFDPQFREFVNLEEFMCDYHFDRFCPTVYMPRIFSI